MTFKELYVNIMIQCCHLIRFVFFLFLKGNYSLYLNLEQFSRVFKIFQTSGELSKHVSIIWSSHFSPISLLSDFLILTCKLWSPPHSNEVKSLYPFWSFPLWFQYHSWASLLHPSKVLYLPYTSFPTAQSWSSFL